MHVQSWTHESKVFVNDELCADIFHINFHFFKKIF